MSDSPNPFVYFFQWVAGIEDNRKILGHVIDAPQSEKEKAMQQEIATLKAQLGKVIAGENKQKEEEKNRDKEKEVKKDLTEQREKLDKELIEDNISLVKLFKNIRLSDLDITDKDGVQVFGKLGDWQVVTKGKLAGLMCLKDQYGNVISVSRSIDRLIYKPEGLGEQIKRKHIKIPKYADMSPLIDYEDLEVNDIFYDEESKEYKETIVYKKKFKEIMIEKEKNIREQGGYIERLESAQKIQTFTINDLKRSLEQYKNKEQTLNTELSTVSKTQMQLIANLGDYQRKVANLTELKAVNETMKETYQNIIEKLLEKIKNMGDIDLYTRIKTEVYNDMEAMKKLLPETVIEQREPEKVEVQVPQPGQNIGSRRNV